jgi:BTB/POZ domain
MKLNLSQAVLMATSSFFADMFTVGEPDVGEPVSQTRLPEESAINAAESSRVLDALFSISYAHPNNPKPAIDSFSQLAELVQVAEKYGMHQALDYLSTQLVLPRMVAGITVGPFIVTHPVASLALATAHGFTMAARLALREVLNANDTAWDIIQEDEGLEGIALDYRIVKRINRMRKTRSNDYETFIESLVPCKPAHCPNEFCGNWSLSTWKILLLKKMNGAPNVAVFTSAFLTGWYCDYCDVNVNTLNLSTFKAFIEAQTAREAQLPQLC